MTDSLRAMDFKKPIMQRIPVKGKGWIALFSLVFIVGVGALDYFTGEEVSVALFYLIPISLCVWLIGKWPGVMAAVGSEGASFMANSVLPHHPYNLTIAYWNSAMRLGVFLAYTFTLFSFKTILESLEKEQVCSQKLAVQIMSAQEEERKRIARELHDEASQALTGLSLRIEQLKLLIHQSPIRVSVCSDHLDQLKGLTAQILGEIRRLAFNLRPAMLEDLGLSRSLSTLFRDQLRRRGIQVTFYADDPELRLAPQIELTLFRISQEAVANIVKYSHATEITAKLTHMDNRLHLEISDNGIGFDQGILNGGNSPHLGIFGMMERVSLLSGQFKLSSIPGKGTTISLSIPLSLQNAAGELTANAAK